MFTEPLLGNGLVKSVTIFNDAVSISQSTASTGKMPINNSLEKSHRNLI
jgi:hypothetical protein